MGKEKVKRWIGGGPEGKFIKRKISSGRITARTRPSELKTLWPDMFGNFSKQVVSNHLEKQLQASADRK